MNCGECDICGANWHATVSEETVHHTYVELHRVCGVCGHRMPSGTITIEQYNASHIDTEALQ